MSNLIKRLTALRPREGRYAAKHPVRTTFLTIGGGIVGATGVALILWGVSNLFALRLRDKLDATYGSNLPQNSITLDQLALNPDLLQEIDTTKTIHSGSNASESTITIRGNTVPVEGGFLKITTNTISNGMSRSTQLFIDVHGDLEIASRLKDYFGRKGITYKQYEGNSSILDGVPAKAVFRIPAEGLIRDGEFVDALGADKQSYDRVKKGVLRSDLPNYQIKRWEDFEATLSPEGMRAGSIISYGFDGTITIDEIAGVKVDKEFEDIFLDRMMARGYFSKTGNSRWTATERLYSAASSPKPLLEEVVKVIQEQVDYDYKKIDSLHFYFPEIINLRKKSEIKNKEDATAYLNENYPGNRISVPFRKGRAVCHEYALDTVAAWRILQGFDGRLTGVELQYVSDADMNHAWVAAISGDSITYLDPTWSDGTSHKDERYNLNAVDKYHSFSRLPQNQ